MADHSEFLPYRPPTWMPRTPRAPDMRVIVPNAWNLTESEARAVQFLATGLTTAEIARALGLSVHTIRTQLKSAMAKADAHTQVALVVRLYATVR